MIGGSAISPIWPKCRPPPENVAAQCSASIRCMLSLPRSRCITVRIRRPAANGSTISTSMRRQCPVLPRTQPSKSWCDSQWFGATHWAARSAVLVDYGAVGACKRAVLEPLYRRFREHDLAENGTARTALGRSFRQFQQGGGKSLADFAVFEALHEHHCKERRGFSWRSWPAPLRDPRSREVSAFAAANCERVEFFQYLQWEADRQLGGRSRGGQGGWTFDRVIPRSRGWRRPEWRRGLGRSGLGRAPGLDRRPARYT